MIIDHIGDYFFPEDLWWRAIGRIATPIWFFLAGYAHPNKARYTKTGYEIVIVAGLLVVADFIFGRGIFPTNVLVSIIFCWIFVANVAARDRDFFSFAILLIAILMLYPIAAYMFEYGSLALLIALSGFYYRKGRDALAITSMIISAIAFIITQHFGFSFNYYQTIVMSIGVICSFWLLHNISTAGFSCKNAFLDKTIMFLGRNSLYVYFYHIVLFLILAWWIGSSGSELFDFRLLNKLTN